MDFELKFGGVRFNAPYLVQVGEIELRFVCIDIGPKWPYLQIFAHFSHFTECTVMNTMDTNTERAFACHVCACVNLPHQNGSSFDKIYTENMLQLLKAISMP